MNSMYLYLKKWRRGVSNENGDDFVRQILLCYIGTYATFFLFWSENGSRNLPIYFFLNIDFGKKFKTTNFSFALKYS